MDIYCVPGTDPDAKNLKTTSTFKGGGKNKT